MNREEPSAAVPARDKQAEEDLWQRHKAERGVWTEPMLAALARGLKGNKWFSLIDKVSTDRTLQLVEPIFENRFAKHSYGFRPGRGCKDALRRVEELIKSGRPHVVEVDIKGYFDAIPHDRLMALVRKHLADGRVLGLIEGFLKQGVMEDAELAKTMADLPADESQDESHGTPQGGVISPLLANIYLDPLDWLMAGLGFEMVRYADDMVVLCRSQEEAEAALETLRDWMAGAGLTLHPDKTRTVDMTVADSHFDFLGYRFKRSRRGGMIRLVRPKSLCKLRESIKPRTRRNNGKSMEAIVADLNRTLPGWFGYFQHVKASQLGEIDGWIRMRLRSILRKRRGLEGRGRGKDHQRWRNCYFKKLGLFCLLDAREAEIASLRNGVNC